MSYVNILHAFLFTRKICALFYGLRKIVCISQYLTVFHTFSVNSQNTFFSAFVYNKYLVLIQTCSRTIVDLK